MSHTIAFQVKNPAPQVVGFEVRATKKRDYVDQFVTLLHSLYDTDPRMVGFRDSHESDVRRYNDPDNHVLLVLHEGQVIGGACVRISTPKFPVSLDLEADILPRAGQPFFTLHGQFPDLDLQNFAYAECNDVAIHPDYRNGTVLRSLFRGIIEFYQRYHVRYLFAASDIVRLKAYKRVLKCLGEDVNILTAYGYEREGVQMHMLHGEFRSYREARMAKNQQGTPIGLKALNSSA